MAWRLLRRSCSYVVAADKHVTRTWRSTTGVAPITVTKLLQQWRSIKPNHDHRLDHFPEIQSPRAVVDRQVTHGKGRHEWTFTGVNVSKLGVNAFSGEQSPPVSQKQTPFNRSYASRNVSRSSKENLQTGRKLLHTAGHLPLELHGKMGTLGPLAMAYACANNIPRPRSTRAYSKRATPEFESLFTKQPGMHDALAGEDKLKKVTVVGVGNVGMACAQTILTEKLTDAIALVDMDPKKLRGEMLDLQHAAAFMPTVSIVADTDYKITANSDVCIITAGARQREGEDRLSLVDRNVQVFKQIIPKLVKYSPNTIFLVISNPVDILSWVTWKLSGFPPNRVLGSGTNLDSSRFRFLLANHFKVSAHNVHAHILGEHGDSSVPVWSSVSVAGVPVTAFLLNRGESNDEEVLKLAHQAVVEGAYEVIKLKGYTSWAIGYSAAGLVSSILRNQRRVHPVSIMAQGFHGIKEEVYISLPAMLGRLGVHAVVNSEFDKDEIRQLHASAAQIWDIQSKLKM